MWPFLLLLLALGDKKKAGASSSSSSSPAMELDADSLLARFTAGTITATLYARPRPTWRVATAVGKIIGQGSANGASELVRPMLESFTEATQGLAIQAQMFDEDRWLSIFVFPSGEKWGWSVTDGVQTVSGDAQDTRGLALLAAMARIEDGPPKAEEGDGTDG